MIKLFKAKNVFLCVLKSKEIEKHQLNMLDEYIKDEHPNVILKERGITGCSSIEEVSASEIPFISFVSAKFTLKLIKDLLSENPNFGTFEKIVLICKKETFDKNIINEFRKFSYEEVVVFGGSAYLFSQERTKISYVEVAGQASS